MVVLIVTDRANNSEFVANGGKSRHVFGKEHAGHAGGNWLELAADFRGGIRLGIECFDMAGAAIQPEKNTACWRRGWLAWVLSGAQRANKPATQQSAQPKA